MNTSKNNWESEDLERRLCHALDVAQSTVEGLGECGYGVERDRGADGGPESGPRLSPEKIVTESALLLLAAYAACGGADCVAARGGIRRRVHRLAESLSPLARSERTMLAMCVQPSMALDFAAAHIYLTRVGYPDLRFDKVLMEVLWGGARPAKERMPHRALEQEWLLWMGSVEDNRFARELALRQSALGRPMDLIAASRDDISAFTRALMFGRDFDWQPLPLPRERDAILGEAEAALACCLDEEDYDLAGEVLLAWPFTAGPKGGTGSGGRSWSAAAAFGFEVLARVEDRVGFLPSPGTRVDQARALIGEDRKKYLLATAYHTVYVMGHVCAAALGPGKAPPARVEENMAGVIPGAAARMVAHLDWDVRLSQWWNEFQLLDLDQQDALASLVFHLAVRRYVKRGNYAGLAGLLGEADAFGFGGFPLAQQAGELLNRLGVVAEILDQQKSRRARAA